MDLELDGRTALVTGGSSGIGLATVCRLIAEGMNVATCARDGQRLAKAMRSVQLREGAVLHHGSCDVLDSDALQRFIDRAEEAAGPIEVLVCNAGGGRLSSFADTDRDAWQDELSLKFFSVLNPVWKLVPRLRTTGGSIVIVNALLAVEPETWMAATSAARAGLLNLARTLSRDLAPSVRVNSVLLGLIESEQWRRRYGDSGTTLSEGEWLASIAADRGIPLGRLGRPEEVADVIACLASPRSGYVSGAAIEVAGGQGRTA